MGCVSYCVEHCNNVLIQRRVDGNNVCSRNAYIFSECTVTVYAYAVCVLTPLDISVTAVTAVAAGNVSFTGNSLSYSEACYTFTELSDLTNILMSDNHRRFYVLS